MENHFTVRGVPRSISRDGWWLSSSESEGAGYTEAEPPLRETNVSEAFGKLPMLGVFLLVVLADVLFWKHSLGLSLALFAAAIFTVATYRVPLKSLVRPAILLTLGALPVIEYVQLLSLTFLGAALISALIWAHQPRDRNVSQITAAVRLLLAIPVAGGASALQHLRFLKADTQGTSAHFLKTFVGNWAFPLGGTLVFFTLLIDANPFFAQVLSLDLEIQPVLKRIAFWFGVALLIWPMVDGFRFDDRAFTSPIRPQHLPGLGLNAASVLRALVVFNLLIGVQIYADFSIFVGRGDLPEGMTYASYAHRGAYPLVVTALLAGAFAICARPFLASNGVLKPLLLLWLVQNVILCLSAGLRLDLYIEAYGLTYLRIWALIWMGVVALGLSITAWQILQTYSNRWLILRYAALGGATLYICCFVNFAALIARTNILHQHPNITYICDLGPTASRAIDQAISEVKRRDIEPWPVNSISRLEQCRARPTIDGWRDWGVRKWRVTG